MVSSSVGDGGGSKEAVFRKSPADGNVGKVMMFCGLAAATDGATQKMCNQGRSAVWRHTAGTAPIWLETA